MPEKITTKNGEMKTKREITIRDEDYKIDLVGWGESSDMLNLAEG